MSKMMTAKFRKRKNGYVLVTLVFILVALLGFAALALDVGVLYGAHTSAQRAVDAAALAGAFTFITSPTATNPVGLATQRAVETATQNQILTDIIQPGEVTVAVDYPNRMVTVDITHPVNTFFAKALFVGFANIHAQGIAEAALAPTGGKCVKPWFIPNSVLSSLEPCNACLDALNNLLVVPGTNTANTNLLDNLGMRGQSFTIKPSNPNAALAPGQFYAVELSGTGGSDYRDDIATCPQIATIFCLNTYSVKTGDMIGPTIQGVTRLITKEGTVSPDIFHSFLNNVGMFQKPNGIITDTSHQMVIAPIWDVCSTLDCSPGNRNKLTGTNVQIPVVGFALIFIDGVQGNDVIARILDVQGCGMTPPTTTETGPFGVPLRLVRTN